MDGILDDLFSPRWWFSVVLVALLVSILADYIPKLFGRYIKAWEERNEKVRQARDARISYLAAHPDEISDEWAIALWDITIGIFFGTGFLIALVLSSITEYALSEGVYFVMAAFLAIRFYVYITRAGESRRAAVQARRRIRKLSEGEKEDDD